VRIIPFRLKVMSYFLACSCREAVASFLMEFRFLAR